MKNIKYTLSVMLVLALLILTNCKGGGEPTPSDIDQMLEDLQNGGIGWVLGSVSKDGYDVTDQFTGFKLSVGEYTYTTVNGMAPVWEASGTWSFKNDNPNLVVRGDGTEVAVVLGTGTLKLTFNAEGVPSGGRTEGIAGEYQFNLVSE